MHKAVRLTGPDLDVTAIQVARGPPAFEQVGPGTSFPIDMSSCEDNVWWSSSNTTQQCSGHCHKCKRLQETTKVRMGGHGQRHCRSARNPQ